MDPGKDQVDNVVELITVHTKYSRVWALGFTVFRSCIIVNMLISHAVAAELQTRRFLDIWSQLFCSKYEVKWVLN